MSIIGTSTNYRAPGDEMVFGGIDKSVEELNKIVRIFKLEKTLPVDAEKKEAKLQKLTSVWEAAQSSLQTSLPAAKETIKNGLNGLKERGAPPIAPIYTPELTSDDTAEIGEKIQKFLNDSKCVAITPVKKSAGGLKGPTYLVRYTAPEGGRAYVIKCSDLTEEVSNRVYDTYRSGFIVPSSACFDLVKNRYGSPHLEAINVPNDVSQHIKKSVTKLIEVDDPMIEKMPNIEHLMLSERVIGQDLIVFAYTTYNNLTDDQKKQFFKLVGKLGMGDLVLGNMDRVVQVSDEHELTDKLEANLGNVMVSYKNNNIDVYAIDNGIAQNLIDNQTYRNGYLEFLRTHFEKEDPFGLLADNIIQNLRNGFNSQSDEIKSKYRSDEGKNQTDNKIDENLQTFYNDLKSIAPEALRHGLLSMAQRLKKKVSGEEPTEVLKLKEYLQQVYPEYLNSIQERFNVFSKISIPGMKA